MLAQIPSSLPYLNFLSCHCIFSASRRDYGRLLRPGHLVRDGVEGWDKRPHCGCRASPRQQAEQDSVPGLQQQQIGDEGTQPPGSLAVLLDPHPCSCAPAAHCILTACPSHSSQFIRSADYSVSASCGRASWQPLAHAQPPSWQQDRHRRRHHRRLQRCATGSLVGDVACSVTARCTAGLSRWLPRFSAPASRETLGRERLGLLSLPA